MKATIGNKEVQINDIETQMLDIKDVAWKMVTGFKESHFFLAVAQHMQYDEDLTFNENNVTMYLAELEEYISLLITYLAHREKNPDAAFSALSLENMEPKPPKKDPLNIDAPSANDYANIEDDATAEDEIVTNPRDLYRKFEELANKGYIGGN